MNQIQKYNRDTFGVNIFSLFDQLHDSFWASPEIQFNRNWRPTEISESDEEYKIEIELPRFKKEEVKVEATKGVLKVVAKNGRASYTREFGLPYAALSESDVKLADGVLTISVPKSGEGQTKHLEIK